MVLRPCVLLPRGTSGGVGTRAGVEARAWGWVWEGSRPHNTHRQSSAGTPLEGTAPTLGWHAPHTLRVAIPCIVQPKITSVASLLPSRRVTCLGTASRAQNIITPTVMLSHSLAKAHRRPTLTSVQDNQQQRPSAAFPPRRVSGGRGAAGQLRGSRGWVAMSG